MRSFSILIAETSQWAGYYDVENDSGELFCPTENPPQVGEPVRVKVTFTAGPSVFIQGIAIWRRPASKGPSRLRPGVGILVNDTDRPKLDFLRGFARGGMLDKRGFRRLPARLRVTYRTASGRRMNFTRDITRNGILLSVATLLPIDTVVELTVVPPPQFPPLKLNGTVVRHVQDENGKAMGIRLDFANSQEEQLFTRLVEELEKAFSAGTLSDEFTN